MKEATDANDKDGYKIIEKLKPTIEKIKKMVSGGSEITGKEFTEWGKTLKKIVEGKTDLKTKKDGVAKKKEQKGVEDLDDAVEEAGSDYMSWDGDNWGPAPTAPSLAHAYAPAPTTTYYYGYAESQKNNRPDDNRVIGGLNIAF